MEKAGVCFVHRERTVTALIKCELDHHTAKGVREAIDREIFLYRPHIIILDFGGVGFMDSSGIALILGRAEVAGELGATVELTGVSPEIAKLIRLSGMERVKNLCITND